MHYIQLPVNIQWGLDLMLFRPFVMVSPFLSYQLAKESSIKGMNWNTDKLGYGIGLGADVFYNDAIGKETNRGLFRTDVEYKQSDKIRAGVSINNELQFGRVTAMIDWGVYLYNPARNFYNDGDSPYYKIGEERPLFYKMHRAGADEAWHYIRFGVKCRVWDNIYVQALAKTHMHIAEQIEFGVGYNIPFISKSKRRDSKDVIFHNREGWWKNY
jgi:hypothetical protein